MDIRKKSIKVVCCYAREDQQFLNELNKHLASLQRVGDVTLWADIHIFPGTEWERELHTRLDQAQIILLLVSASFIQSDYCYHQEMQRALQRHQRGEASVIPVILTPVMWQITPLRALQALPKDAKPITTWPNEDEAYKNVAEGTRQIVEALKRGQVSDKRKRRDKIRNHLKNIENTIIRGNYQNAYRDITELSKQASKEKLIQEAARLKYLEALVHLNGKRPYAQSPSVMKQVEAALLDASNLHNLCSYKKILALLKQDFARTGVEVKKNKDEAHKLLGHANRLPVKQEDREIIALFSRCYPQLSQEYSHLLPR